MNILSLDLWGYLSDFIKFNKDKCYLMMTCKGISKCNFYFTEIIDNRIIVKSIWYHHFVNVSIHSIHEEFPSLVRSVYLVPWLHITSLKEFIPSTVTKLSIDTEQLFNNSIPSSITDLYLGGNFRKSLSKSLSNRIPETVKKLTFDASFNQNIIGCIPSSVTELYFGYLFNQSIEGCLPTSIKKLVFGCNFNQPIKDSIPSSVIYLSFGNVFCQSIKNCIPPSVIELHLCYRYIIYFCDHEDEYIPSSVKKIFIHGYISDDRKIYIQNRITNSKFTFYDY